MPRRQNESPLLIIAFDAGDSHFIQQGVRDGTLPNLAGIMRQGSWGLVSDSPLSCEFGQWRTLLSGIPREEHGYYYFRQLRSGTYDLYPVSHATTKIVPFWAALRGTGKTVAIIDAPECAPLAGLDGVQLSEWSARHLPQRVLPLSAEPPGFLNEARRVFGRRIRVVDYSPRSTPKEDSRVLGLMLERIDRKGRLCRHLMTNNRYDLMVIGYFEGHDAGHRFWEYRPDNQVKDPGAAPQLAHGISLVYQAIDHEIGRLQAACHQDATIAVVSCYGMAEGFPTAGLIDDFCRMLGYQVLCTPRRTRNLLDLVRRTVPGNWRHAISERLPVAFQERLLADQLRTCTDWARTRAFGIPSAFTSFVRVNLRNREPQGAVSPGKDYDDVVDDIAAQITALRDAATGEPAVELVERTGEVIGKPPVDLPDLFIRWKPSRRFLGRLAHPLGEISQRPAWFHRGSGHSSEGFFAASGPLIVPRGRFDAIDPLAVAPTLLTMMGIQVPPVMRGKPLGAMFASGARPES